MKHIIWPLILVCLFIAGCDDARSVPSEHRHGHLPTVGDTIGHVGTWVTIAGSAALAAGILAFAASFFPWTSFLAIFRTAIIEAIALGFAAILVGSSFLWLGAHPWLIAVVIALVGAGLAWRYRRTVCRFFGYPKSVK